MLVNNGGCLIENNDANLEQNSDLKARGSLLSDEKRHLVQPLIALKSETCLKSFLFFLEIHSLHLGEIGRAARAMEMSVVRYCPPP